jgi:hypothetical protein
MYNDFWPEKAILEEKPYNPTKHFIHQLPEIIRFCAWIFITWIIYLTVIQAMAVVAIATVFEISDEQNIKELVSEVKREL